jgi:hypothetical protein
MKSSDIRAKFLKFFEERGHAIVASSSLVPGNDPTLLFTNSGMVQFKDVFLEQGGAAYKRATTSQRLVRAGGSTTTSRTSATRRGITRSSRCWATSASATTSRRTRSITRGTC